MHYATHVVSPVLGLLDGLAEYVCCIGSGTVNEHIAMKSSSAFAVEACHIRIKDSDIGAHIWLKHHPLIASIRAARCKRFSFFFAIRGTIRCC